MNEIRGLREAQAILGPFCLSEFSTVCELRFYYCKSEAQPAAMLEMVLQSEGKDRDFRMHLRFAGVTGLRLEGFGSALTQIMGFEIADIADRGWEGLFWRIGDYEDDKIEFFCHTAEIAWVKPILP
jgi:hypothetical protein